MSRALLTRAREAQLDADLALTRASLNGLRSGLRRRRWRDASQRRTTMIAAALRHLSRAVAGGACARRKVAGVWIFSTRGVDVVALDARTPGRTLLDLLTPPRVMVVQGPEVNIGEIEALARRGVVRLEVSHG